MIFRIQRYLEDYFSQRTLADNDQYAVKLANTYANIPNTSSESETLAAIHKIRTIFYSINRSLSRNDFEKILVRILRARFQKKNDELIFPGGVTQEKVYFTKNRLTIFTVLTKFKNAVQARTISRFWISRTKGKLVKNAEDFAQSLLTAFVLGVFIERPKSNVFRELPSGIGFVDVAIKLSSTVHLVELKILTSKFVGAKQLEKYMKTEGRNEGWLLVFDARSASAKTVLPPIINSPQGKIRVLQIDINPIPPSKLSK